MSYWRMFTAATNSSSSLWVNTSQEVMELTSEKFERTNQSLSTGYGRRVAELSDICGQRMS